MRSCASVSISALVTDFRRPTACVCLALAGAVDLILWASDPGWVALAVVDETAHLATALLVLAAFGPGPAVAALGLLVGGTLLDLDHIPAILREGGLGDADARPLTHSAVTALALACGAALLPGRARAFFAGAAVGVGVHLVRDLATGPGVPLGWPLSHESATIPYSAYALCLGILLAVAWRRR